VLIMTDEVIGHMSEKVIIPRASAIKTISRPKPTGRGKDRFKPFKPGPLGVAPMPAAGEGYRFHVTGLTHDEKGYPAMSVEAQKEMMERLIGKIQRNRADIIRTEGHRLEDAELVVVSYGISARTGLAAVEEARRMGIKAGLLRLITVWPFAEEVIGKLALTAKAFITVEINLGQIHREVERCVAGRAPALLVGHAGGTIIGPDRVIETMQEVL
jgi:2-oxoglutarate/2-oxoacid ferredoxin oxidoreductase subunit alpha